MGLEKKQGLPYERVVILEGGEENERLALGIKESHPYASMEFYIVRSRKKGIKKNPVARKND